MITISSDQSRIPVPWGPVVLLLLCLTGSWWAVSCHADEPVNWSQYNNWEITSFDVTGAPDGLAGDLKGGLAMTGQWKLLSDHQRPPFSAQILAEDLERIRLFLAVRGYPAAQVLPAAVPEARSRQVAVVINVTPGEPVRIGEIRFSGWPEGVAVPDTADHEFLRVGQIVEDEVVSNGRAAVRDYLQNSGYAQVQVNQELVPLGPGRVGIHFAIEAGDFYVIDEVAVTGCSDDLVDIAHRVINIPPDTEYAETHLTDASLNLRLTQLFRKVSLVPEPISPGHLRLVAELENGRMRVWDASVGTWSDNPWMVKSSWTHRNLFKRGRGFITHGAFATHEARLGVGVFWLGWLSPRARTRVGTEFIAEREDAYDSAEYRLEMVQSFRPRQRDILNIGTALSENEINEKVPNDSDTPEQQGRLWEIWSDVKWDRTDDPIFPSRGGFLKLALTFAEPWVFSEVPYAAAQVDGGSYLGLPLGMVFTARTRVGVAKPIKDGTEVLANRRFYAGGYNSHRGYQRRGLGPRDQQDYSRGGEVVVLVSGEVRFPLIWVLEGGLFVDSGNIWWKIEDVALSEYPVAAGATIGLRSPIGPLRVGYAVNISDLVPGQPRELWHFGIGYPW